MSNIIQSISFMGLQIFFLKITFTFRCCFRIFIIIIIIMRNTFKIIFKKIARQVFLFDKFQGLMSFCFTKEINIFAVFLHNTSKDIFKHLLILTILLISEDYSIIKSLFFNEKFVLKILFFVVKHQELKLTSATASLLFYLPLNLLSMLFKSVFIEEVRWISRNIILFSDEFPYSINNRISLSFLLSPLLDFGIDHLYNSVKQSRLFFKFWESSLKISTSLILFLFIFARLIFGWCQLPIFLI